MLRFCKECGRNVICEHGGAVVRPMLDGSGIYEHRRKRFYCKECGGVGICGAAAPSLHVLRAARGPLWMHTGEGGDCARGCGPHAGERDGSGSGGV